MFSSKYSPANIKDKVQQLSYICMMLNDSKIQFTLGGSGLLYFMNIVDTFNDWDIVLYSPFCEVKKALPIPLLHPKNKEKNTYLSKYFFQIKQNNTNFDMIGFFGVQNTNESYYLPYKISGYWNRIPLGDIHDWKKAYEIMGRKEKALMIESFLS